MKILKVAEGKERKAFSEMCWTVSSKKFPFPKSLKYFQNEEFWNSIFISEYYMFNENVFKGI